MLGSSGPQPFLAPGTGFMEDSFSMEAGRWGGGGGRGEAGDGSGSNESDGERQMKLCPLTRCSPPAVRPGFVTGCGPAPVHARGLGTPAGWYC